MDNEKFIKRSFLAIVGLNLIGFSVICWLVFLLITKVLIPLVDKF